MNKDEHYEIIDDCKGEKTPETAGNVQVEDTEKTCPKSDSTTQQQDSKTNTGTVWN